MSDDMSYVNISAFQPLKKSASVGPGTGVSGHFLNPSNPSGSDISNSGFPKLPPSSHVFRSVPRPGFIAPLVQQIKPAPSSSTTTDLFTSLTLSLPESGSETSKISDQLASDLGILAFLVILGFVSSKFAGSNAKGTRTRFNVLDYGAAGDGKTESSQAFLKAWNGACTAARRHTGVIIPENNTFLVNPVIFYGPCKPKRIDFKIQGTIVAPNLPSLWNGRDASQWLAFHAVTGLNVGGPGKIDGRGKGWWDQSCRYHPDLEGCTKLAPTALKIISCNESSLSNIQLTNSPQTHVLIMYCTGLKVDNVMIQSPGTSPNTDGIHIQSSHTLKITNAKIGTGDDCVSIGDHISKLDIANVECGPGHGISKNRVLFDHPIFSTCLTELTGLTGLKTYARAVADSIGSLGRGGSFVQVENIRVRNSSFNGTTNGARIKTWQVGKGYVRKVLFENLEFHGVQNPLIIDQNYCHARGACKELRTGVQVSQVIYKHLFGTSTTGVAISLNCSRSVPCSEISMQSIKLTSARAGRQVTAKCSNAHGTESGVVPGPCLRRLDE
ncbi:hypothetical protein RJ639_020561 [Escallonia herrerae]|uniref:Polygalacturonase n=1 Tax=Escallonia herrerae TaxID=1293975 RepID=A0AA88V485_9ASTE|nr:hypothetical protein RJ639_020561 [Escallonia herrerae]